MSHDTYFPSPFQESDFFQVSSFRRLFPKTVFPIFQRTLSAKIYKSFHKSKYLLIKFKSVMRIF